MYSGTCKGERKRKGICSCMVAVEVFQPSWSGSGTGYWIYLPLSLCISYIIWEGARASFSNFPEDSTVGDHQCQSAIVPRNRLLKSYLDHDEAIWPFSLDRNMFFLKISLSSFSRQRKGQQMLFPDLGCRSSKPSSVKFSIWFLQVGKKWKALLHTSQDRSANVAITTIAARQNV